ncbi:MAG: hypothetical protein KDB16_14095, partial [Acidimicrobiales bacterium]|nr:hypothetical protein [Acidimicrobiales bacterium]
MAARGAVAEALRGAAAVEHCHPPPSTCACGQWNAAQFDDLRFRWRPVELGEVGLQEALPRGSRFAGAFSRRLTDEAEQWDDEPAASIEVAAAAVGAWVLECLAPALPRVSELSA